MDVKERARDLRLPIRSATYVVQPIDNHFIAITDRIGQVFHLAVNKDDKGIALAIVHRLNEVKD
jgi:hypothetical protein